MDIYKKLYLDDIIKNEDEIFQKLSEGEIIYNLYLICVNKKGNNLFEIFESKYIFNKFNKDREYIVVGMCYGKYKAFDIIKDIFNEYLTLGKDIKKMKLNFLKNK